MSNNEKKKLYHASYYDRLSESYRPHRSAPTIALPNCTPPQTIQAFGRPLIAPNSDFARAVVMGNEQSSRSNNKRIQINAPNTNKNTTARPVSNLTALLSQEEEAETGGDPGPHVQDSSENNNDPAEKREHHSSDEADSASGPPPPPPLYHLGSSAPGDVQRGQRDAAVAVDSPHARQFSAGHMLLDAQHQPMGTSPLHAYSDKVRRCISSKELGTLAPPSGSPYANMMLQKEELESTMRERLQALREHSAASEPIEHSGSSVNNAQVSGVASRRPQGSNDLRNQRRAEHTQAVEDELCELVAELFLSESKLLKPFQYGVPDRTHHQRDQLVHSIHAFITSLPSRYALGVDTPSEVLLHMRLMAAARADQSKAAVHIHNITENNIGGCGRKYAAVTREHNKVVRLVTVSCRDTTGLLELITKNLASGGSRVLDADVMLSTDGIVLDRFVVEMNGRLRLDKLANLIESFVKSDGKDGQGQKDSPVASSPGQASGSETGGPLYYKATATPERHTPLDLQQEIKSAVPFPDFLASSANSQLSVPKLHRIHSMPIKTGSGSNVASFILPQRPSRLRMEDGVPIAASPDSRPVSPKPDPAVTATPEFVPLEKRGSSLRERRPLVNRRATSDLDQLSPPAEKKAVVQAALNIDASEEEDVKTPGAIDYVTIPSSELGYGAESREIPLIPFEELMLIETIGTGRVSTIYRAAWQHRSVDATTKVSPLSNVEMVALKVAMVNTITGDLSNIDEMRREADIAARLDHPNICGLAGVAADDECFCLAYEFCEGGSLLSLLSDTSRYYEYLPIALDIANGMAYLHSRNVIHRDLKPSNVLITRDHRAKVADFGMSVANYGQELTQETGTYRYMAPELIRHEGYSSNADVYSFGLCLWQLITREVPFATMTPIQAAYAVAQGRRPEIPDSTPRRLREIIMACWDQDNHKRPSFTYITMALADYAKMAFSPANVGAFTLQIANEMLASVEGNSTVNVDFTTPVATMPSGFLANEDNESYHSNVGLEI